MVLSLRPGGTTLWLRGVRTPGIYRVNVPIQNEVQNQYETHQRLPLKVATRLREQPIIGPGWIEGASREGSRTERSARLVPNRERLEARWVSSRGS